MNRPIILITSWARELPTPTDQQANLYTLGANYVERILEAGGLPLIAAEVPSALVPALLDRVDGLLLSGGDDVSDASRDLMELELVSCATERLMPIFGVCRGLQIINAHRGGTLVPDLPDSVDHPAALSPALRNSRHALFTETGWVQDALEASPIVVSLHHQAIERLGVGVTVTARAGDGTIEAIEVAGGSQFVRAVQWHPEKMPGVSGLKHAVALLGPFVRAAFDYHQRTRVGSTRKDNL